MDTGFMLMVGGGVLLLGGISTFVWSKNPWMVVCGVIFGAICGAAILFTGSAMKSETSRHEKMSPYSHVWVVTEGTDGTVEFWEVKKLPERPKKAEVRKGWKMPDGGMIHFDGSDAAPTKNDKE